MKKNNFSILIIFFFILFLSHNSFSIEDSILLPKTGHRKPAILFNHKAHSVMNGAECVTCHHKSQNQKCSSQGCHMKRDQVNVINLKGAFHQQCHECHRKTSGPKACGKCHVKK